MSKKDLPSHTISIVGFNGVGKSSLCKRLIYSHLDNYNNLGITTPDRKELLQNPWLYWGNVKHRRQDDKYEVLLHFIEQTELNDVGSRDNHETYIKRASAVTIKVDEKLTTNNTSFVSNTGDDYLSSNSFLSYPLLKRFPREFRVKSHVDAFICVYDLSGDDNLCSSQLQQSQFDLFLSLLNSLLKTKRPLLIVTTKNDIVYRQNIQVEVSSKFEQRLRNFLVNTTTLSTTDIQTHLPPILHTSSQENINIQSIYGILVKLCEQSSISNRKSSSNTSLLFQIPSYIDDLKQQEKLQQILIEDYRQLLIRHVLDFRDTTWLRFYQKWHQHIGVERFIETFGKKQAEIVYNERIENLKQSYTNTYKQKIIDQRLIKIIHLLTNEKNLLLSARNWNYLKSQMQKHPLYSSTVIKTSFTTLSNQYFDDSNLLKIPEEIFNSEEAKTKYDDYIRQQQLNTKRLQYSQEFFGLLDLFSNAGLIRYGQSTLDKDCVYFLGRDCYEHLNLQDRLAVFVLHQKHLYKGLNKQFIELLFESIETFIQTFHKMNQNENLSTTNNRKVTTVSIDDIFENEIINQIKHDSRYQALSSHENDRHRLIMCHCHFLYDTIYYRLFKNEQQHRKRSFKRNNSSKRIKSTSIVLVKDDDYECPYVKKFYVGNDEKTEIHCPMGDKCIDVKSHEILRNVNVNNSSPYKSTSQSKTKYIVLCGNDNDVFECLKIFQTEYPNNEIGQYIVRLLTLDDIKTKKIQNLSGCIFVSPNGRQMLSEWMKNKVTSVNERSIFHDILFVNLFSKLEDNTTLPTSHSLHTNHDVFSSFSTQQSYSNIPNDSEYFLVASSSHPIPTFDQLKTCIKTLLTYQKSTTSKLYNHTVNKENKVDLKILFCLTCGDNDAQNISILVEQIMEQFKISRCLKVYSNSFVIEIFLGKIRRKIEFVFNSFHSVFSSKLNKFDGFILLYNSNRCAAFNTIRYVLNYISNKFYNKLDDVSINSEHPSIPQPPIFLLCCLDDKAKSNMTLINHKMTSIHQTEQQKNLYQNGISNKYNNDDDGENVRKKLIKFHVKTINDFVQNHLLSFLYDCWLSRHTDENDSGSGDRLFAGVTSYFAQQSSLYVPSTSNLMTCSLERNLNNRIQKYDPRLFPSVTSTVTKSNEHSPSHAIILTPTNVDTDDTLFCYRSYPHLSSTSPDDISSIMKDSSNFTIVPTTPIENAFSSPLASSTTSVHTPQCVKKSNSTRFPHLLEHPKGTNYLPTSDIILKKNENSKQQMKLISNNRNMNQRSATEVKVPLATPEIIEFNDNHMLELNIESITTKTTTDEAMTTSLTDSSMVQLTYANTDSSIDNSSSDERVKAVALTLSSSPQQSTTNLQRKLSDRKSKRIRNTKKSDNGLGSSTEMYKKTGSDDDIIDNQKQKKKRRPSFKRRKKMNYDTTQTDSGIDSHSKDATILMKTEITVVSNEEDSSVGDYTKDSKNTSIEELEERPTANWIRRQLQHFSRKDKSESKSPSNASIGTSSSTTITLITPLVYKYTTTITSTPSGHMPLSSSTISTDNTKYHYAERIPLSKCILQQETGVPRFIQNCISFIEKYGLSCEGLYRVSGYRNQVDLVIKSLIDDPDYDLHVLEVSASAVATAFKEMMRRLHEPILSLDLFNDCKNLTGSQLQEQNFLPLKEAFKHLTDVNYITAKVIFKHLNFVSQHAESTHMDSSNLSLMWWPNLYQPQFTDLPMAGETCQKIKPLVQAIIEHYSIIFDDTVNQR